MEKNIKELLRASRDMILEENTAKSTELYVKIFVSLSNIVGKELAEKCLGELIKEEF